MNYKAMNLDFELFTSVSGSSYSGLLLPLCESLALSTDIKPVLHIMYTSDIDKKYMYALQSIYPFIRLIPSQAMEKGPTLSIHSLIASKMKAWENFLKISSCSTIIFIDADMLALPNLASKISELLNDEFSIGFTYKPDGVPINTGFFIARKDSYSEAFVKQWAKETSNSMKNGFTKEFYDYGAYDQVAIAKVLGWNIRESINENVARYANTRVRPLPCNLWNNCSVGGSRDSHLIHFKHGIREIAEIRMPYTRARPYDQESEKLIVWDYINKAAATRIRSYFGLANVSNFTVMINNLHLKCIPLQSISTGLQLDKENSLLQILAKLLIIFGLVEPLGIYMEQCIVLLPSSYAFVKSLCNFRLWLKRFNRSLRNQSLPIRFR